MILVYHNITEWYRGYVLCNLPYQYPLPKTKQTVFGIHCRLYLHHPKSCRQGPVIDPFLKSIIIMKWFFIFSSIINFLNYCKRLFYVPLTWTKVSLLFLIFIMFRKHDVIWNRTFEISFPNASFLALSNNSSPHNNFKCKTNSWTNPKESKWHTIYLEKIKRAISTRPWQVKTIVIILWKKIFYLPCYSM